MEDCNTDRLTRLIGLDFGYPDTRRRNRATDMVSQETSQAFHDVGHQAPRINLAWSQISTSWTAMRLMTYTMLGAVMEFFGATGWPMNDVLDDRSIYDVVVSETWTTGTGVHGRVSCGRWNADAWTDGEVNELWRRLCRSGHCDWRHKGAMWLQSHG
jgi:hypothetical protein